ncbi:hypothetical protein FGO68_gene16265 [Halteria grandinella]|uniref:Structural maintenance of chromosomes protein n=1 Tax=Halteria grandinella TaxID=5974 RepID=A0A8J8P635_HALGN|nr:hypothetical protein FGO68_gene16265 [Halteria grandinella]
MHIIEIILEGFKSYPVRTSISNLDPQFNAITGLNGSGKSNIIDAICFVLGISSLSNVRVTSLQELIYKQGNAGVTKASVTLVFDNSNKRLSPPSLQGEDKVVISRAIYDNKSRYTLNGKVETADKIKQLFMQISLNVNNPHFLVMQGRIAQIVTMRSDAILSLIEEASGTSLYENRKLASLKLISKKQSKLDEISSIVLQEITPQLDRLRKDKEQYERFRANERELGTLWKQIVAFEYHNSDKVRNSKQTEVDSMKGQGEELVKLIDGQKGEIDALEDEIQAAKRNDISQIRAQWDVMQKDMVRLDKDLVEKQATLKNLEKNLRDNENVQKKLTRYIDDLMRGFDKNKKRREEVMLLVRKYKREYDLKKEQLKQIMQAVRDLNEGKDIAIDEGVQLKHQQLNETKKNLEITCTEIKQVKSTIMRLEREAKETNESFQNLQKSNDAIRAQIMKVQGELKTAQEQLQQRQYNQRGELEKTNEKKKNEDLLKELTKRLESLAVGTEQKLETRFTPPTDDFDRDLVRGRVAKLFQLKEDKFATALEAIAGNKLYYVVVDNDVAASMLIKNDSFGHRVNMIPNNKIMSKDVKKEVRDYVNNVAKGRARFALDLIKYHVHVENTMKYLFGNVLVCDDAETAKKLAFDAYVKLKTVTLEGDIYHPTGVLEGGHTQEQNGMLKKVRELQRLEDERKYLNGKVLDLHNELNLIKKRAQDFHEKESEVSLLEHQLRLLKDRLEVDQRDALSIRLRNLEEDLQDAQNKETTLLDFEGKYRDEIVTLTHEIADFETKKDRKKELLDDMHTKLRMEIESVTKELKSHQREVDKLEYEGEENEKDLRSSREQLAKEQAEQRKFSEELESLRSLTEEYARLRLEKRDKMKQLQQDQIKATSKIKEQLEAKQKCEKAREANLSEVRKLDQRIQKLTVEINEQVTKINALEKENAWILTERHMFGNPESAEYKFDPQSFNMVEKTRRFYRLKEETSTLKKTVNLRVDTMATQAETDYTELIKKRDKVLGDKDRIEKAISELDTLKNATLSHTYTEVNASFKKIFSTLLPGAMAELTLADPQNIQAGVNIRVGFANDWKDSLSELSGGQRSLLALSFVLSLLKYKPAPLYILDEIDAALDLSHTQNIGKMIRQHFPESQFIIISLKEGMFSNANVLFKVDFGEGKSRITRYQQQASQKQKGLGLMDSAQSSGIQ